MNAIIDIGTNTFHLLIGETDKQSTKIVYKNTIAVKLGEGGGISRKEIIPAAYQRGLDALLIFRKEINRYPVKSVKATATAAIRDASNGKQFVADVLTLTNIKIEIIDGLQEAFYIYEGAKAAKALNKQTSLIMDIGGGSTEFIICNQDGIFWKESYRLGAARLLSDFHKNDPLKAEDIQSIHSHFNKTLIELHQTLKQFLPTQLVGTAGSFDSYRDIILAKKKQDFRTENSILFTLDRQEFTALLTQLIQSSHQERKVLKGLIALRTDMILMASVLTQYILDISKIETVTTCTYSLKEGILFGNKPENI